MDFNSFSSHISKLKKTALGGLNSQLKMAPAIRKNFDLESMVKDNPRNAAVLALFYPDSTLETNLLLTLRASYNGTHSAQISFPGGKVEKEDKNLEFTALRETFEETAVITDDISIYRQFSKTYIPPSNFWVTPFMGTINYRPKFIASNEVSTFIEVKLKDLLDEKSVISKKMSTSYMESVDVPCFKLNNYIVWGATAMILSEIKDFLK